MLRVFRESEGERVKKRWYLAGAAIIAAAFMAAGCANKTVGTTAATEQTEGVKAEDGSSIRIGVVLSIDGLGDQNMNDMTYEAMNNAQKDFGITFDYTTPASVNEYEQAQRLYAETGDYDLIIILGSANKDGLIKVSDEYPDQRFTWLDGDVEKTNIRILKTDWPQQTFLCGVIAGLGTKSDMPKANPDAQIVGCVLAEEQPFLVSGTIGFEAGARYVNPDVQVLHATVGSFSDPGKAKEIALSMYEKGADFIQHIAAGSGLGVFNAAVEADRYAFGVGSPQNYIEPDHIVATSLKDVKTLMYNEVKSLLDGSWRDGIMTLNLKNGGTNYSTQDSNVEIPEEITAAVEEIRQMVIDGKLDIPATREEMEEWLKTNSYGR
jgi:basic membrane lipoprotein Med (substrate-binding protein (PBP1-ABC) superfamily)